MEQRSNSHRCGKGKQVCTSGADIDKISSLPSDVVDHILQFLPLEDATRTSILSRYWRYKWALLPHLILDEKFFDVLGISALGTGTPDDLLASSYQYSKIVNNVLLRHIGHIHKFVLFIPRWFRESTDINQWIQFVSTNDVKEFTLHMDDIRGEPEKKLPSCLFLSAGLTHLTLIMKSCIPSLPPMFSGFPYLISLKLRSHRIWSSCKEMDTLQILISSCPQLESIDLLLYADGSLLTIDAPKLQKLVIIGVLCNIYLKTTAKIKTLSLNAYWLSKKGVGGFFCCFPNVETLVISNLFWKVFCRQVALLEKVDNELGHLRALKLVDMPIKCSGAISVAVYLFQSSPQLQNLYIKFSCDDFEDMLHQTEEDFRLQCLKKVEDFRLQCLKKVELVSISNSTHDLQLIKSLLACSPTLEVMIVEPYEKMEVAEERLKIARDLMRYHRASSNAEIIFKG